MTLRLRLLPLGVAAALLVAAVAHAAGGWRVLGTGSAAGDFAVAMATGQAARPAALGIRVAVTRRQPVTGFAVVGCASRGRIRTGHHRIAGVGPYTRALPLPARRPDRCTLAVTASIARGGRLSVSALAR